MKKLLFTYLFCLATVALWAHTAPPATIVYVKPGATGTGTTWADAMSNLQNAIDKIGTNEVWVMAGTYTPAASGSSFVMKNGVAIYGGFAGTETALSARNWTTNVTKLNGYNAMVIKNLNLNNTAILDGFTVTGGVGTFGGGIYNNNASPTLINLNISGNTAGNYGGGIFNINSSPILTNVTISGNVGTSGGGIYNEISSPILTNVTISGNRATNIGGMYNSNNSNPQIRNSIIFGNNTGVYNTGSLPTYSNSLVQDLTATTNGNISAGTLIAADIFNAPLAPGLSTAGDYTLKLGSPAINAGDNTLFTAGQTPDLSAINRDLIGNLRIFGSNIDLGAYEFLVPPTITSFTPTSAKPGDAITLTGTNFNTTAANNIVFFGATRATVTNATANSLTVTVPTGATFAPITLLNTATSLAAYSSTNFYPTFTPSKGIITSSDIAAKVDFGTGTSPNSVAIGDIDGDGKPDLAIANSNSANVSVLLNTGSGGTVSFANKVDFSTGTAPYSVAIGDIDGDGKPDLVIANSVSNTISVLRNMSSTGTINFALKADFATGTKPQSVVIGDIDGDGKPDVATANNTFSTISVLRNMSGGGTLSFANKVDFSTGTAPYSVAIGDLDGDGKPDLATANSGSSDVSVLRNMSNSGTISFAGNVDFATGGSPYSVSIGDIDGDGKADVATANFSDNTVSILRNTTTNGTISFASKINFTSGRNPTSVAIGDIDGDGKPDLAIGNFIGSLTSLLRNTSSSGAVSFANKVDFASGSNSLSVAIGDLDGDGKPDLAVANNGTNNVSILRNKPVFPPTISSFSPVSGNVGASVVITGTEFDITPAHNTVFFGATIAEVIAATETSLTVTVPLGATHSVISVRNAAKNLVAYSQKQFIPTFKPNKDSFTPADFAAKIDLATQTKPGYIAFGDLDGDGKVDMAVTNETSNTVSLFLNTGTSGNPTYAARRDFTTGTQPEGVALGDIDGDGKLDIAVTNFNSNSVSIFRNTSTLGVLNVAVRVNYALGSSPFFVVIRDINGDGRADLITANKDANTISVVLNTGSVGTISFDAAINLSTGAGSQPYAVTVGDLDGDGKPDIAAAGYGTNMISVFRNIGPIGSAIFAAQQDFPVNTPYSISIGDLDGDGLLDLATANLTQKTVSILKNTSISGTINFAPKVDLNTDQDPDPNSKTYSVAIGDLNGDGKPDIAATNYFSNTVSLFANQSTTGTFSFASRQDVATGVGPDYVAIGDMDGDGKSDLVVANYTANTVSILRNKLIAISTSGTLAALSTVYGAGASTTSTSFTIEASNLLTGITITPPTGFELSQVAGGASGYAGNGTAITVGAAGTVASTTIYARLAAGNAGGTYSGNIVCTSTSANTVNVATVSSTVTGAPLTITANNVSRTYGTILTGAVGATTFTSTGLLNGDNIG